MESMWAHGVAVSHPLCMRKALGSIPSVSSVAVSARATAFGTGGRERKKRHCIAVFAGDLKSSRAHGVVVSHPLRMRKALGSNPSVSTQLGGRSLGAAKAAAFAKTAGW